MISIGVVVLGEYAAKLPAFLLVYGFLDQFGLMR
jgi:hypothetical protein